MSCTICRLQHCLVLLQTQSNTGTRAHGESVQVIMQEYWTTFPRFEAVKLRSSKRRSKLHHNDFGRECTRTISAHHYFTIATNFPLQPQIKVLVADEHWRSLMSRTRALLFNSCGPVFCKLRRGTVANLHAVQDITMLHMVDLCSHESSSCWSPHNKIKHRMTYNPMRWSVDQTLALGAMLDQERISV